MCTILALLADRTQAGNDPFLPGSSADSSIPGAGFPDYIGAIGKSLQIIQFKGPIQDKWVEAVEATGAEIVHYTGSYGYLVWAGESSSRQLESLAAKSAFLRSRTPYVASQKTGRELDRALNREDADEDIVVTIQMLRHDGRYQTEKLINTLIIEPLSGWEPVLNYQNMRALVTTTTIEKIAHLPDVVWIGVYHPPQLMDERQGQILAGNLDVSQTVPGGPGFLDWLKERGFSSDPKDYPIIDITDDGIGDGIAATAAGDQTLRTAGNPDLASRLIYLKNCTSAPDASSPNGHGHINASIAAGYDTRAGEPYQDSFDYQRAMGVNPFGRLAGTRVFNGSTFDCASSYLSILNQSYRAGARIVSNSWGCTSTECTSQYSSAAQAYDTAVRDADDATPGNQELLILFSAGNEGRPGTIGSPANAKNVITVGASENVRPGWTDSCGIGPFQADNVQDIWAKSSRGPAPGGRVKPDLVAPGTHVTGTASTSPFYNGSNICDKYYPDSQQLFAASSGTSHSVPAVAGIASLASYWLTEKLNIEKPSPALLKAYLVANTRYLTRNNANDDLPSHNQGYGLPDMTRAFDDRARIILDQDQVPLFDESGQSWSLNILPANRGLPLRIVMAFTDAPGILPDVLSDPQHPRVNDLDLLVSTSGETYLGNEMDGQWSKTGGVADPVNTVEAVFLPAGASATVEIQIIGSNIAGDGVPGVGDITDQDFVLVCENCKPAGSEYQLYFPVLIP